MPLLFLWNDIMVSNCLNGFEKEVADMKNKTIAWTAVLVWMALIFILSHQPASVSSGLSSRITVFLLGLVGDILPGGDAGAEQFHTFVRKNAHFIAYFILSVLLVNALGSWNDLRRRDLLISFTVAVLYGASDEFHQLFIEGRSGELRDVAIDGAGAAAGILLCWALNLITQKRNRHPKRRL